MVMALMHLTSMFKRVKATVKIASNACSLTADPDPTSYHLRCDSTSYAPMTIDEQGIPARRRPVPCPRKFVEFDEDGPICTV